MADDEARARVAQLEKEKRQRDFQVRRAAARGAYASHALPGGGTPGSRGADSGRAGRRSARCLRLVPPGPPRLAAGRVTRATLCTHAVLGAGVAAQKDQGGE